MKRYSIPMTVEYNGIEEDPEGEWVRYEDVEKLVEYVDAILESYPRFFWPDFATQEQLMKMKE